MSGIGVFDADRGEMARPDDREPVPGGRVRGGCAPMGGSGVGPATRPGGASFDRGLVVTGEESPDNERFSHAASASPLSA